TKACKELDNEVSVTKGKSRQGADDERKGTGGLRCICFNARSVVGKADELRAWISTWEYDVIAITETWLREGHDWQLNIPGYRCFRRDREGGKRGGGVALLVKEDITAVLKEGTMEDSSSEAIWAELRNRKGAVTMLGLYYRPPNSEREIEVQICKQIMERCRSNRVVVIGDFNFPNIDWDSLSVRGPDGAEFVRSIQEGFLEQYVNSPTREGAILDLVLGNEPGQVVEVSVGDYFGNSDHNSVSFKILMDKDESGPKGKVLNWGKANYTKIRQELGNVDWEQLFEGKSTCDMWEAFKERLISVQERHVPVKMRDRNGKIREPWMTGEIVRLAKRKKEAYIRSRRLMKDEALKEYRECRTNLKRGIKRAKRGHEISLANRVKENPKAFYSYIRSKRVTRERIGPLKDKGGKLCVESEKMGEILNEYFASVFTEERDMTDVEVRNRCLITLGQVGIRREEVLGILKGIKVDKSPGPDGIYPRLLREAREEIAGALTDIFAASLNTGEVPEDWRIANVVPLFKKGSRDNPGNYRPVSLTSVVGKLLEKILRDRIYSHLEENGLISDRQHGFVQGRSCLTNLIEFFEEVTKLIDEGRAVDVIYMDFSKAFDKVPHGRLMEKVKALGVQGVLARWIKNWLGNRRQRVAVEGSFSKWRRVTSGVPQGSVLGPLLFVIYINDLEESIGGLISKFADDTKIGGVADSEGDCQRIQQNIDRLESWAEKWQMEFNQGKCEVMHFGRSNSRVNYTVNGKVLGKIDVQRDLGVQVHCSLKVATQVNRVVKKAYGMLSFIGRGIEYKSWQVMLQLYRTLVRPHLEYCVQFWSPHYQKDVDALERVQRRFTRMLPGMEGASYEERLSRLGLFSLERRRLRGDLIEVYKIMRGIDRVDSKRLFPRVGVSITRGHEFKVKGEKFRGDMRGKFFTQRVVGAWNALPAEVVDAGTIASFKMYLDRYMNGQEEKRYRTLENRRHV
ncbi:hypothetical protein CYV29_15670, partial [Carnobacterium maltaromaticum]|uniref:reverse transcriptase domain-containing protein n=1 Tax=Carnobacterium maltaromaticum TaxID=2751 RepID=UPI000C77F16C